MAVKVYFVRLRQVPAGKCSHHLLFASPRTWWVYNVVDVCEGPVPRSALGPRALSRTPLPLSTPNIALFVLTALLPQQFVVVGQRSGNCSTCRRVLLPGITTTSINWRLLNYEFTHRLLRSLVTLTSEIGKSMLLQTLGPLVNFLLRINKLIL